MSISEVDIDCTSFCRLAAHGNALAKCLTKREISEEKLISFLLMTCGNFARNLDEYVATTIIRLQQVITLPSF